MLRLFTPLYLLLLLIALLFSGALDSIEIWLAGAGYQQDVLDDYSGFFAMAKWAFEQAPTEQYAQLAKAFSSPNVPLHIANIAALKLSPEQLQPLLEGQLVVLNAEDDLLIQLLDDGRSVLKVGPIGTHQQLIWAEALTSVGMLLTLLSIIGVWAWRLQSKIRHLSLTATRFGEGDFQHRASEAGLQRLGLLNQRFNSMAEQIESLINSHRHLINAVAHELRTPLSRIRFDITLSQEESDNTALKHNLLSIEQDLDELEALISELLTYARYQAKNLHLTFTPIHAQQLLQHWHQQFRPVDRDTQIVCAPLSATAKSLCLLVNQQAFIRLLDNLVLNACNYANGKVELSIDKHLEHAVIRVDDNGPGIPVEQRATLFDAFVRADTSRSRTTGGVGLGLAIAKQITEKHQGQIAILDSPLGGARFELSFPVIATTTRANHPLAAK